MFESGFKNVNINLTSANPRRTFSCGDTVTGTLSFDLTKETKITSITMALTGNVDVHWSTGSGGKKRHRRHFSAKINLFNLKSVLLQENSVDFPSSFHGIHGRIQYLLTVSIDRPWHFAKSFETELHFLERISNRPELWVRMLAPLSGSNSMNVCCLCWTSGPVELTATLERKAFMRGKIICEINNASSRTVTPKARLKERQTYYTHGRHNRNSGTRNLVTQNGEHIKPNTPDVHKELLLTIPTNTHLGSSEVITLRLLLHLRYFRQYLTYVSIRKPKSFHFYQIEYSIGYDLCSVSTILAATVNTVVLPMCKTLYLPCLKEALSATRT
uniref:Arrestin-like N-terminal domain-containing protein n=1 Tax=Periophthalmus magnuspinnatus TaxID=409849 RepID=A0A3B4AKI5_9GOBI